MLPLIYIGNIAYRSDTGGLAVFTALYQSQPRDVIDQVLYNFINGDGHEVLRFISTEQESALDDLFMSVKFFNVPGYYGYGSFMKSPQGKIFQEALDKLRIFDENGKVCGYKYDLPEELRIDNVKEIEECTNIIKRAYGKDGTLLKPKCNLS